MVKIIEEIRLENMTCLLVERFNLATIILMTDVTSEMLETVYVGDILISPTSHNAVTNIKLIHLLIKPAVHTEGSRFGIQGGLKHGFCWSDNLKIKNIRMVSF